MDQNGELTEARPSVSVDADGEEWISEDELMKMVGCSRHAIRREAGICPHCSEELHAHDVTKNLLPELLQASSIVMAGMLAGGIVRSGVHRGQMCFERADLDASFAAARAFATRLAFECTQYLNGDLDDEEAEAEPREDR